MRGKRRESFFERLTGTINVDEDEYDEYEDDDGSDAHHRDPERQTSRPEAPQEPEEGELTIDMYQTPEQIVLQAMVAGVRPDDLDISITREMVTIKGRREGPRGIDPQDYYHRELYWGAFSRSVVLPQEIEVEEAEANEKHGLLIIKLPKIDKARQTKLKVKSS